jgi:surface antigen
MSMPIASLATSSEDTAGGAPKSSFARFLGSEDLRRAEAALATALDPQGDGSLVGWENPESGIKGSFTPIGQAYPADARICRVFVSRIDRKGNEQSMRGTACAEKAGDWTIAEVSPLKKT